MISDKQTRYIWLIILLLIAMLMRAWNYHSLSLSNDELSAWNRLNATSIAELWENGVKPDGHPALVQTTLYLWFKIFPSEPWSFRLLFIIAGTLSVGIFFRIAYRLAGEGTAWLGASCMSALQYFIIYSQLARPYAFGLLFTLMAYDGWSLYFYKKSKLIYLIYFALSGILALYSHYFSFLMVIIFSLSGIIQMNRKQFISYLFIGILMAASFIPHIHITLRQLNEGGVGGKDGWLAPPTYQFLVHYIFYAFNKSWLVISAVLLVSLVSWLDYLKKNKLQFSDKKLLISWLIYWILPIAIGFYYSRLRNPVLQNSVVIFSFPFFLLIIFYAAKNIPNYRSRLLGFLLLIVIAGSTVFEKQYYQRTHWAEFKDLAVHIFEWKKKYGDNVYIVAAANAPGYLGYYLNKFNPPIQADQYIQNQNADWVALRKKWTTLPQSYFALCWSNQFTPPEWTAFIRETYPIVLHKEYYLNSEIWLFGKTGTPITEPAPLAAFYFNAQTKQFEENKNTQADTFFYSYTFTEEFSPNFEIPAHEIIQNSTDILWLKATLEIADTTCNPHLVFSLLDADGKTIFWRSREKKYQFDGTSGTLWLAERMTMREFNRKHHIIKCYLWNPDKCNIILKNLIIEICPGNPIIYGYP
ncbi:MAG: glycosyltransferase family 39 protein [Flavobacteriales bacterium]|nr:glycosyltransferase family 39 protein [Flavobacteriales bacterium]